MQHNAEWKKRSERRKQCALAVVKRSQKNFVPPQTPFPRARNGQNLISWRWSLPLPTNPVWWGSMHAILSYRGNRHTNKHTHKHTKTHTHTKSQTGPITIHCTAASAQCNEQFFNARRTRMLWTLDYMSQWYSWLCCLYWLISTRRLAIANTTRVSVVSQKFLARAILLAHLVWSPWKLCSPFPVLCAQIREVQKKLGTPRSCSLGWGRGWPHVLPCQIWSL